MTDTWTVIQFFCHETRILLIHRIHKILRTADTFISPDKRGAAGKLPVLPENSVGVIGNLFPHSHAA